MDLLVKLVFLNTLSQIFGSSLRKLHSWCPKFSESTKYGQNIFSSWGRSICVFLFWFQKCKITLVTNCTLTNYWRKTLNFRDLKYFQKTFFLALVPFKGAFCPWTIYSKVMFEISVKIRIFWYPYWPISRKIIFWSYIQKWTFYDQKMAFSQEMAKNKLKTYLWIDLGIFPAIQIKSI
jgi:hypothetical protein